MTAKQNAKLNMYRTIESHLADNESIIAVNPAFQTAFNKLKTNNTNIRTTAQSKSAKTTGIAADKSKSKQTLCKLTATLAGAVFAYAAANGDETLKQEMNLPVSKLARTRDEALVPRCQNIQDKAQTNIAALADYGIKKEQLTALQTAIGNYSAETVKPRTAVTNRKTATTNLAAIFKENDQLDKLIEQFRPDHPDFVQTYEASRIIVDPPVRIREPKTLEPTS